MTDDTLKTTSETQIFPNSIEEKFLQNLDSATEEFLQKGTISLETIEKILGKVPIIPDSPDMDARQEAYEEKCEYSRMALAIESRIRASVEGRS